MGRNSKIKRDLKKKGKKKKNHKTNSSIKKYLDKFAPSNDTLPQAKQELKRKKITHKAIFIELENAAVKSTIPLQ